MKYLTFLAAMLLSLTVHAADVYVEGDYSAIWDNLDQDVTSVGAGIAFHPTEKLMIDVGADYIVNNDLSRSGFVGSYNTKEGHQRSSFRQYEDDFLVGIKVRYNIWSF